MKALIKQAEEEEEPGGGGGRAMMVCMARKIMADISEAGEQAFQCW